MNIRCISASNTAGSTYTSRCTRPSSTSEEKSPCLTAARLSALVGSDRRPTMNLLDIYRANAADRGLEPAVTFALPQFDGVTLTWGGLIERSEALAERLSEAGVGAGTRLAQP